MKMPNEYNCLHEEQIQDHSLQIKALQTELNFKKEKLDEIKSDNKRMEQKIDEIKETVNQIVIASKTDDDELDKRITAIETRQEISDKKQKESIEKIKLWIAIITAFFMILTFYFNYIHHL